MVATAILISRKLLTTSLLHGAVSVIQSPEIIISLTLWEARLSIKMLPKVKTILMTDTSMSRMLDVGGTRVVWNV